jgi:integrase
VTPRSSRSGRSVDRFNTPRCFRRSLTSFRGNYRKRYFSLAVARYEKDDETFPDITPHDLRHTPASLAISSGANVKAV